MNDCMKYKKLLMGLIDDELTSEEITDIQQHLTRCAECRKEYEELKSTGKKIVKTLGLVRGNTIRVRHIGRDIMAALKNLVGGEVREYTKLMAESREQAIDRMVAEAERIGGNAVIGLRFTTSMLMGGAAELLAYGTAVKIEDE